MTAWISISPARTVASLFVALLVTGCKGPDLGLAAEQALRWTERADDAAALSALVYAGSTKGDTGEAMVALATPAIMAALTPSCVINTKIEGARATFTFEGCNGEDESHGVRSLAGTVSAAYATNDFTADTLKVDIDTQGLSLNGRSGELSLALGNVFPASSWGADPLREMAFHLADRSPPSSNTENRDALLSFSGSFQAPPDCDAGTKSPPRIDAATGLVSVDDGAAWTISASNYVRCGAQCPRSGTILAQLEIALKVELDGSARAQVSDLGSGETTEVALDCVP
jgi:hypothetical protein